MRDDEGFREFLKLLQSTESDASAEIKALAAAVLAASLKYGIKSKRSQQRVLAVVTQFIAGYTTVVVDGVARVADQQARRQAMLLLPKLEAVGAVNEAQRQRKTFEGYSEEIRRRFPAVRHPVDKRTFINRVTRLQAGTAARVYEIMERGVDLGIDPRKVAYAIRDYVLQDVPGSARATAYSQLKDVPRTFVYKGSPGGSIQYNANRIVRTEMARIYRNSTTDFYDGRPYTEGYDWVLSNWHPRTDQCDRFKSDGPYESSADLPQSHPHCLCRVVAQVMSQQALKRLIASGALN